MTATAHHEHTHPHPHPENPWAGQGSVLLDIGGDVGAMVVTMPAQLEGLEVEIRPTDREEHHHPHVAVVNRPVGDGTVPSLVFGELLAGDYELYVKGTTQVELRARVSGGEVTQATWPDGPRG